MCYIVEEFMEKGRTEGLRIGRKQGRSEGLKIGWQESRIEILCNMFSEGISIETIKNLGFTDDEIRSVQDLLFTKEY